MFMRILQKLQFKLFILFFLLAFTVLFTTKAEAASYYQRGILKSENVLSGADIGDINNFSITATVPASTTVSISFSQDKNIYYNASSTKGAWTDVASGTTVVDLSELSWTGALLFYKLKLETTDSSSTPRVGEIRVNYDGTAVPDATSTRYCQRGIVVSENLLSGFTVSAISSWQATSTIASGTAIQVSFSQDKINFYSSDGTNWGWDELADGFNSIDLSGLAWTGASLYYKVKMQATDQALQPKISEVRAVYSGTENTASSSDYNWSGAFVSSDLMASTTEVGPFFYHLFAYSVDYLPSGSSLKVQFSPDNQNWYSSDGTPWSYDTLEEGANIYPGSALDLSSLGWEATSSFYFKLKYNLGADNSYSPIVSDIRLYYRRPPDSTLRGNVRFRGDVLIK